MMNRLFFILSFVVSISVSGQSTKTVFPEGESRFGNRNNSRNMAKEQIIGNAGLSGSFSFMISGGLSYLYGSDIGDKSFDFDLSGWDGEVMFGYGYYYPSGDVSALLGLFIHGGVLSSESLQKFIADGGLNKIADDKPDNVFYNFEGGAVLGGFLRLSSGLGFQEYELNSGSLHRLKYYSTTVGVLIGGRNVKLSIQINMMYGRDLSQTLYKPGVGLALVL